MSDSIAPATPFPAERTSPSAAPADPLAGDWSEGLRGPVRALGIPEPRLIGEPQPPPAPASVNAGVTDTFHVPVLRPDVTPPSPAPSLLPDLTPPSPAPLLRPDVTPPSPAPSFQPDVTPPSPAPSFQPDVTPPSRAAFESEALRAAAAAFKAEITPTLAVPAPLIPPPPETPPPATAEGVVELRAEDAAAAHVATGVEQAPALRAKGAPAAEPSASHTPGTDADIWSSAVTPAGPAPTPWREPAAPPAPVAPPDSPWGQAPVAHEAASSPGWEMAAPAAGQVVATEDVVWSAPPPAEPVSEWKAEAPSDDWQSVKKSEAPPPEATSADWSTISRGPDWSAPAPAAPASDETWGAAPPPPVADAWSAAPSEPVESEWSAPPPAPPAAAQTDWAPPAAPAQPEWTAPVAAPAAESDWSAPPPKAWGGPPVGASALEQLDSEQMEPDPAAAKQLFGSVPMGGSLSADDEFGPPEELASPEEVLKPVNPDDDPDLLVPVDESKPAPRPTGKPLAMMKPPGAGALEVSGEYRVAIQTRGGSTRRGTVRDIDLSKSQFVLQPQGGGSTETVYHAEVKAIFFMLAPGEKPRNGDGGRVRVTFADSRSIEGTRDGADAKHGFFLVPTDAARTNTRRIYIAREATSKIEEL